MRNKKIVIDPKSFKHLDLKKHVLEAPDMYVGSVKKSTKDDLIFDEESGRFVFETIEYIPALERIFIEALSNATDHFIKSGGGDGLILEFDNKKISVSNYGGNILPIVPSQYPNLRVPELIFGEMLSSSNYELEERTGAGRNGLGIKLANIFSNNFQVEICTGKEIYKQTWRNHMDIKEHFSIQKATGNNYVKIAFEPDLDLFEDIDSLETMKPLLIRYAYDVAIHFPDIPVVYNNQEIPLGLSPLDYLKMCKNVKRVAKLCSEVYLAEHGNYSISFVNCLRTRLGGEHEIGAYRSLGEKLSEILPKQPTNYSLRSHFILLVIVRLNNPVFNSQSKEYLSAPSKLSFPDMELPEDITEWEAFRRMESEMNKKSRKQENKVEKPLIPDLEDANLAGVPGQSSKCTLLLTEGKSALGYAVKAISFLGPEARDYYGTYPLRGKLINVVRYTEERNTRNREIMDLLKIIGNEENPRYGRVIVMADADVDGIHIVGLCLNLFSTKYSKLLSTGKFFGFYKSPIVKFSNGWKFYSEKDIPDNIPSNVSRKYLKGLGSANEKDIKEDFKESAFVFFSGGKEDIKNAEDLLNAFDKGKTDIRKKWVLELEENEDGNLENQEGVISPSIFIRRDLTNYIKYSVKRSIPSLIDGLKESQRKILYGSLEFAPYSGKSTVKVAQLASHVAKITHYHHGEMNIAETIVKMAQSFVGSNNYPFFVEDGQYGTRVYGGNDCANPRYIYTKLQKWIRLVFRKEDDPLLSYINEEGYAIEPQFFLPVIPVALLNGCSGIGTGFSTSIPPFSLEDVLDWMEDYLKSSYNVLPTWNPKVWYRNFSGVVEEFPDEGYVETRGTWKGALEITELPIGVWTNKYKNYLDTLKEQKLLDSYSNFSSHDKVHFCLRKMRGDTKLVNRISMRNMTLLNENGIPMKFNKVSDILNYFMKFRLEWYEKRRLLIIENLKKKQEIIENKYQIVKLVVENKVPIANQTNQFIHEKLIEHGVKNPSVIDKMFLKDISKDNMEKLSLELEQIEKKIEDMHNTSSKDMWLQEIREVREMCRQ